MNAACSVLVCFLVYYDIPMSSDAFVLCCVECSRWAWQAQASDGPSVSSTSKTSKESKYSVFVFLYLFPPLANRCICGAKITSSWYFLSVFLPCILSFSRGDLLPFPMRLRQRFRLAPAVRSRRVSKRHPTAKLMSSMSQLDKRKKTRKRRRSVHRSHHFMLPLRRPQLLTPTMKAAALPAMSTSRRSVCSRAATVCER